MTRIPPLALLTGGLATRLRPLTEQVPKAMIEVAGEPFIAHQLRLLRREGVPRVVLCVGYLGKKIEQFVSNGSKFGIAVEYCYDGPELLGTGGALRRAIGMLGQEFLVMYGDSWLDTSFAPIVDAFRAGGKSAMMTVYRNDNQWDKSNVWFEDGRILVHDKMHRLEQMRHIDWGLGIIKAGILRSWPANSPFDLAAVYSGLARKGDLGGFEIATRFYEIGSREGLRETDALLRGSGQSL